MTAPARNLRPLLLALLAISVVAAAACERPGEPNAAQGPSQAPAIQALGATPQAPTAAKTPPPAPSPRLEVGAQQSGVGAGSGFSVHEWGLVQFSLLGTEVATSGYDHQVPVKPPTIRPPIVGPGPIGKPKKPLLYFHPDAGFDPSVAITVTLRMPAGGRVREVWPTPGGGPQPAHFDAYTWPSVRILPNTTCGAELAPKAVTDAPCASLPAGTCEAHEMNEYLRPVPHCLDVSGQRAPVLLYNGTMPADVPPLQLDAAAGTLKNNLPHPVGPVLVRWREKVLEVASLGAGEQVTLSEGSNDYSASVQKRLSVILTDKGLTDAEALSFLKAWEPDALKAPYPWATFGFLSPEAADAMIPLEIFPKPRQVTRVLAFTVE